jgi:hypothetical protein
MKITVTYEIKGATEEMRTPIFQPRWIGMENTHVPKNVVTKMKQWDKLEERTKEKWEEFKPSDIQLDLVWEQLRKTIFFDFNTFLPVELQKLYDKIIKKGPHRVSAPDFQLKLLGAILQQEADHEADNCEYECSVFVSSLYGEISL